MKWVDELKRANPALFRLANIKDEDELATSRGCWDEQEAGQIGLFLAERFLVGLYDNTNAGRKTTPGKKNKTALGEFDDHNTWNESRPDHDYMAAKLYYDGDPAGPLRLRRRPVLLWGSQFCTLHDKGLVLPSSTQPMFKGTGPYVKLSYKHATDRIGRINRDNTHLLALACGVDLKTTSFCKMTYDIDDYEIAELAGSPAAVENDAGVSQVLTAVLGLADEMPWPVASTCHAPQRGQIVYPKRFTGLKIHPYLVISPPSVHQKHGFLVLLRCIPYEKRHQKKKTMVPLGPHGQYPGIQLQWSVDTTKIRGVMRGWKAFEWQWSETGPIVLADVMAKVDPMLRRLYIDDPDHPE